MRIVSIFLMIALLTACVKQPTTSPHAAKKSAPHHTFSFWESLFSNRVQTQRFRSPDIYTIHGRKYRVMKSAAGYHERGLASWYGKRFHHQPTSSGERYNMYALTAAHRTLPLHSSIRVTNVKNGRYVVVRINDRGPFHSSRLIDLSYEAARRIGLFPAGMVMVDIQAISMPKIQSNNHTPLVKKRRARVVHQKPVTRKKSSGVVRNKPVVKQQARHVVPHKPVRKKHLRRGVSRGAVVAKKTLNKT